MDCLIGKTKGVPSKEKTDVPMSKPHVSGWKASKCGPTPTNMIFFTLYTITTSKPTKINTSAPKIGYSNRCTERTKDSGISTLISNPTKWTSEMTCVAPSDFAMWQMKMIKATFVPNWDTTNDTCTANFPHRPAALDAISPKLQVPSLSPHSRSNRMQKAVMAATETIATVENAQPPEPKAPGKKVMPLPTKDFAVASVIDITDMLPAGSPELSSPSSPM
mmetsp:Transcript_69113/g.200557  ORF Transcript_69113/g.200557 Transcript_69113/m.200557 type:complete len:220 (+) Transcript_69113:650-1309(+)